MKFLFRKARFSGQNTAEPFFKAPYHGFVTYAAVLVFVDDVIFIALSFGKVFVRDIPVHPEAPPQLKGYEAEIEPVHYHALVEYHSRHHRL